MRRSGAQVGAARRAEIAATSPSASARTSSDVSNPKPPRPSRLPSTRSTFHAGRVSPSGLTTPWKLCTRPSALTKVPEVSVNGAIGSSTSATSSSAIGMNEVSATTISALRERGARGGDRRRRRARARRSAAGSAFSGGRRRASAPAFRPPSRGMRVDELRADGVAAVAKPAEGRAGLLGDPVRQAPSSGRPAGAARRRCRAARPCARRSAARRRSPWLRRRALARRRRGDRPSPRRPRRRCRPAPRASALGAAAMLGPIGISQSSRTACTLMHLGALACAAWRRRCANSGWSLRRNEPTTSTRCSVGERSDRACRASARRRPCGEVGVAQAVVDVLAAEAAHELGEQVQLFDRADRRRPARRCSARRARP